MPDCHDSSEIPYTVHKRSAKHLIPTKLERVAHEIGGDCVALPPRLSPLPH